LSNNEWMTVLLSLAAIGIAAGWRLLDLFLPKGRMSKWVRDNTVEADPENEEETNG
jgi:hypothetical protein